ncbi:hypothetical protein Sjap_011088 [Stephania japonica]|uniref:Cysteine protease n=1 Tax=Stephania japonica TaxID=461633 RepID=A0AAP0P7S4_9MAGN
MKGLSQKIWSSKSPSKSSIDFPLKDLASSTSDREACETKPSKVSLWSSFIGSTFSIFETHIDSSRSENKASNYRTYGWTTVLKRVVLRSSMRRLQERIIGCSSKTGVTSSTSEIWLLGVRYKVLAEDADHGIGLVEFEKDFSSRVWITYRKGFDVIGDSKYSSDVNWGCMLRSSQMLVAQALLFHCLGRSWRRPLEKPFDKKYIDILHLFGDSESSAFSIHHLLQAGKQYGLAAGSWVGPYAMCRSWETLIRSKGAETSNNYLSMAVYVVSGDEYGERGGAPVVCIEDVAELCAEFDKGHFDWSPILLLVPLVLGPEKVNPRYIPSLKETFMFPQSLGIMGGKPGASTYIIGVQDDEAFYLDPHEVQSVVDIRSGDLEVDTSSYHCNVIRHLPLDTIDSSLAIGFYCRDKDDFNDFCARASKLADQSNGAPLFTVAQMHQQPRPVHQTQVLICSSDGSDMIQRDNNDLKIKHIDNLECPPCEDDWQLL